MIKKYLLIGIIILALDSVYLSLTKNLFAKQIKLVQKKPFKLNIYSAILCYILLTLGISYFVIEKNLSYKEAFLLGFIIYGIFDTTTMSIFKDWNPLLALLDTCWGGFLFTLVLFIYNKINKFL